MASFVVANLQQAAACSVGHADLSKVFVSEALDPLLVKVEDDPFGSEKILEQEVVRSGGTGGGVEHCARGIARPRWTDVIVVRVNGTFAWHRATSAVGQAGIDWDSEELPAAMYLWLTARNADFLSGR